MTYGMVRAVVKDGGITLCFCQDCGALVVNRQLHDVWHTNVIGGLQAATDPRLWTKDGR